jgi:hypothetical protein
MSEDDPKAGPQPDPSQQVGDGLTTPEGGPGIPPDRPETGEAAPPLPERWSELARSAGPPAHWLALFEPDATIQADPPAGIIEQPSPAAAFPEAPQPVPGPAAVSPQGEGVPLVLTGPSLQPPVMAAPSQTPGPGGETALEAGESDVPSPAPISLGQAVASVDLPVRPTLRLRPAQPPRGVSQESRTPRLGETSGDRARMLPLVAAPLASSPTGQVKKPGAVMAVPHQPQPDLLKEVSEPAGLHLPVEPPVTEPQPTPPSAAPNIPLPLRLAPTVRRPTGPGSALTPENGPEKTPPVPVQRQAFSVGLVEPTRQAGQHIRPVAGKPGGGPPVQPPVARVAAPTAKLSPARLEAGPVRQPVADGADAAGPSDLVEPSRSPLPSQPDLPARPAVDGPDLSWEDPGVFSREVPRASPGLPQSFRSVRNPPVEPQWSEPSTAHWPALPDPLPPRPPEPHHRQTPGLRPDHRRRLSQEQRGKPWNA